MIEDIHLSRLPVIVDEAGFQALAREAERFVERIRRIEEASAKRLAKTEDGESIPAHVAVMIFEGAEEPAAAAPKRRSRRRGSQKQSKSRDGSKP